MSEAATAPAEGGAGSGAPAATEGAAAQILESGAVEQAAPETPTEPDRSEHNRRLIEAERLRRKVEAERKAVAEERRAAEAARDEAKRLAEQRNGEADEMAALVRRAKGNPAVFQELLDASDLSMDDYVRFKVGNGEIAPELQLKQLDAALRDEIKQARAELDELKKERDAEKADREQQTAAAKRAEAEAYFMGEIDRALRADPDKYELTIAAGDQDEVFKLIDGFWKKKQVALTAEQAADMVEKYHRDQAPKFKNTKFYSSLFQPQSPAAPASPPTKTATTAKLTDAKRPASTTALTNSTVTSPVTPDDDLQPLVSREEFLEAAKEKVRNARKSASAK